MFGVAILLLFMRVLGVLMLSLVGVIGSLSAFAEDVTVAVAPKQNPILQIVPLVLIFVVFYFLLIRPQQKKSKQHLVLLNGLKVEDRILTSSGIYGTVKRIDNEDGAVVIEVSKNVRITITKSSIVNILVEKDQKSVSKKEKEVEVKKEEEVKNNAVEDNQKSLPSSEPKEVSAE